MEVRKPCAEPERKLILVLEAGAHRCRWRCPISSAGGEIFVARRVRVASVSRECEDTLHVDKLRYVWKPPRPPGPNKQGPVFIAALKHGPVFIVASFQSAFIVKCKRADVFSYYPPQRITESAFRSARHGYTDRLSGPLAGWRGGSDGTVGSVWVCVGLSGSA